MNNEYRTANASLLTLIILQVVMLTALYAGVPPHPPVATPLFGISPFIGASIAAASAALVVGSLHAPMGRALCLIAAVMGLISFGPQKYFDPQFALIWPVVIAGQIAAVTLLVQVFQSVRSRETAAA